MCTTHGEILETDIPVQAGQRVMVTTSGAAHVTIDCKIKIR
jgi:hypothetical protein